MRCLEKRPADRPQDAAELVTALDAIHISDGHSAPASATRSRSMKIIGAIAVALVIAGALYAVATGRGLSGVVGGGGRAGAQPVNQLRSVAVLPLTNLSGNANDEYFSDGMTDELANALSKLPGLRVASRTSSYAFKGKPGMAGQIGKELNVQAIIEGTVRRSGDRLRVGAQLTNVSDGLSIWSDTYERTTSDIFTVQDDIAGAIASALKMKLGTSAVELSSTSHGTDNLEAYDSFLRGRYFWNRRGAANLRRALTYFEKSIASDPRFARAYAGMAITYALLPEYSDSAPADALTRARAAATKALALDSTLAEAHTALGLAALHTWEFQTSETEYKNAIALDPSYPTGHQWYGEMLMHTARNDSALAELQRAVSLDPLAPIPHDAYGYALSTAGRYAESVEQISRAEELAPEIGLTRELLGDTYLKMGQTGKAVSELETAARMDRETLLTQGKLCHVYGIAGRTADARRVLKVIEAREGERESRTALAVCHIGLGERAAALDAVDAAVKNREISLLMSYTLILDRIWDPIRGDPRWEGILRAAGLGDYIAAGRKP
jgi:serine/threonine-protein kinase